MTSGGNFAHNPGSTVQSPRDVTRVLTPSQAPVRSLITASPQTASVASLGPTTTFSASGAGAPPTLSTPQWGGWYPSGLAPPPTQFTAPTAPNPSYQGPYQAYQHLLATHTASQQWPGSFGQPGVPHPPPGFPPQPSFPPFSSGMWNPHAFPASVHGSPAFPFSPPPGHPWAQGQTSGYQWPVGYPFGIPATHSGHGRPPAAPHTSWTATTSHPSGATGPTSTTALGSAQPSVSQPDFLADSTPVSGELSDPDESFQDSPSVEGPFSFPETLSLLASVAPERLRERAVPDAPLLSDAEIGIGVRPRLPSQIPVLLESPMVADVFTRVQVQVRGSPSLPDSVPDFPDALGCGKFLKPENTPYFKKPPPIQHKVLPSATLAVSQEDLLLLPPHARPNARRHSTILDKTLAEWEETARRGLETVSIMDTFLAGLVDAVKAPPGEDVPAESSASFTIRSDLDPVVISSCVRTLAEGIRASASTLSRLYSNTVLARRDILLGASNLVQSPSSRASMRVIPPSGTSLFGPYVHAWIKKQAEDNRDSAFAMAPGRGSYRPTKRPAPAHFGQPKFTPKPRRDGEPTEPQPNPTRPRRGAFSNTRRSRGRSGSRFPSKAHRPSNKGYPQ